MSVDNGDRSTAEWIAHLFKVKLSKHKYLKDKVNSLVRNRVVETFSFQSPGRRNKTVLIPHSQKVALHNAVILNGFIDDPAKVNKIFTDGQYRTDTADFLENLLVDSDGLSSPELTNSELRDFFGVLRSDADLKSELLPNPFTELPQVVFNQGISLIQSILLKGFTLSEADVMALNYLNGDIESAYKQALSFKAKSEGAATLQKRIITEYERALEFQKNFSFFMN